MVFLLFWLLVGGLVGYLIGNTKGRGGLGFILGALLGIIGWIIIAVVKPSPEAAARWTQAVAVAAARTAPAWAPDPFGRYGYRWWDGIYWTDRVATDGQESTDPPGFAVPVVDDDGWDDDPFGRFAKREYRNGQWTNKVANSPDTVLRDAPGFPAPIPAPPKD